MAVQTGDIAPDFEQDTINGSIRFHEWMGRSWCILFSQPSSGEQAGAESVSEFAQMARLKPELNRRGVKVVGLSVHSAPEQDGQDDAGWTINFPVIADTDRSVSTLYGLGEAGGEAVQCRLFLIDPDKRVRLVRTYDDEDARDFSEMLHAVDGLRVADGQASGAVRLNRGGVQ